MIKTNMFITAVCILFMMMLMVMINDDDHHHHNGTFYIFNWRMEKKYLIDG